jgi:Tfp pilus assembly protein PilV
MKSFKKLNQTGDTIIEVLMALAILSSSLGISYATANNGLNQSRNAEEHSEALGLLDDQVEKLRTNISSDVLPPANFFCMTSTGTYSSTFTNQYSQSDALDSQHDYSAYPASCTYGLYYVSASSNGSDFGYTNTPATSPESNYTFTIRWNGLGTLGPQQESINYRIGAISETLGNFVLPQSTTAPPEYDSYVDAGAQYGSCVNGEVLFNDSNDGCLPATPVPANQSSTESMYAYRQMFVTYPFSETSSSAQKPTTITISYNQLAGSNAPSNYDFELIACVQTSSYTPTANGQAEPTNTAYFSSLPPSSAETGPCYGSASYLAIPLDLDTTSAATEDAETTATATISGYASGDSIELDWLNNVTEQGDPNLEINSVTLTQKNY